MTLEPEKASGERDGQADFDFLFGRWQVRNRRLKPPLRDSTSWEEFTAAAEARPAWNGLANVDEIVGETATWGTLRGMTVRLYDAKARQWKIYWANQAWGVVDPPVVGAFEDGRGEFYGHELLDGVSIFVRFFWSGITPTSCRWEQAFSWNGGRTWKTNWIMDFTRVP